jgi:NADPH:quinone reductase-like Zn-dependent oxidoreductase
MDIMQRQGKYPLPPQASKTIMGVEFAGEVVKLHGGSKESKEAGIESENGEKWKLGDEVVGLAYGVSLPLSSCIRYVTGSCTTVLGSSMVLTRLEM